MGSRLLTSNFWCNVGHRCRPSISAGKNLVDVLVLSSKNNLLLHMNYLNSKHENLKFILDLENNKSFSFSGC